MSSPEPAGPLLTLEPLLEALRVGVEDAGWTLSGLQKTTSYEFEGRWAGESTRSAYVFFHHEDRWEGANVELYLDETPRGLKGNLQLVLDGPSLGAMADPAGALGDMAAAARTCLPEGYVVPLTLRFSLPRAQDAPKTADGEWRVKLRLPRAAMEAGAGAVAALASATVAAFESLLVHPVVAEHALLD
ncbi:MAG: hypothetical protein KY453_04335 [Gemmatimonadetes bacterium]|nr:hypothetical protein [Gemmatimonadota bacterium]